MCPACFDELKSIGLAALTKKHDPNRDIPLNEVLHRPVIGLPQPRAAKTRCELGPLRRSVLLALAQRLALQERLITNSL